MIELINLKEDQPYIKFKKYFKKAIEKNQKNIDAIAIASFDNSKTGVDVRFVNLKYVVENEWIFFSNYKSLKSSQFEANNNISVVLYWNSIDTQIRMKAKIFRTKESFSDAHYKKRSIKKNAIAVSSSQSTFIKSYDEVVENFKTALNNKELLNNRPKDWGGFSFYPNYFEFWEGHESRINKREVFKFVKETNRWDNFYLQP